jgi:hypothetical protein
MITEIIQLNGDSVDHINHVITGNKLLKMFYQMIGDIKNELDEENAIIFIELANGNILLDASEELKQKVAVAISKT